MLTIRWFFLFFVACAAIYGATRCALAPASPPPRGLQRAKDWRNYPFQIRWDVKDFKWIIYRNTVKSVDANSNCIFAPVITINPPNKFGHAFSYSSLIGRIQRSHCHLPLITYIIRLTYNKCIIILKTPGNAAIYAYHLEVYRMQTLISCTQSVIAWRFCKYCICNVTDPCKFFQNPYKKDHNYITRSFLLLIFLLI